ncbi:hypothetical protein SDC9_93267 [bioreactor metagenome]|uniref:Uncharacterized protein n=1 Tax=bioreactor metagenome TaxID=1076179 RepID=A0A645A6S1_9ZZZZ
MTENWGSSLNVDLAFKVTAVEYVEWGHVE